MTELSDRVNFTQTDLMMVLKDSNCHQYVVLESLTPQPLFFFDQAQNRRRRGANYRLCYLMRIPFAYRNKGVD